MQVATWQIFRPCSFKRYKPCLTCVEMVLPRRSLASMMHDSYMNCTIVLFIHVCTHVCCMFNTVVLWQCIKLCMSNESYDKLTCCSPSIRAVAHIYNLYILCWFVCPFSRDHIWHLGFCWVLCGTVEFPGCHLLQRVDQRLCQRITMVAGAGAREPATNKTFCKEMTYIAS